MRLHLEPVALADGASDEARAEAAAGRISGWREDTRDARMAIAREAQHRFDRTVAWARPSATALRFFTDLLLPVMTRLRQPQRQVLDTLVDAGVARSRADALQWCVRLVGQHTEDWLAELRDAIKNVEVVREQGPTA